MWFVLSQWESRKDVWLGVADRMSIVWEWRWAITEFTRTQTDMSMGSLASSYLQYTVLCVNAHCATLVFLLTRSVAVLLCSCVMLIHLTDIFIQSDLHERQDITQKCSWAVDGPRVDLWLVWNLNLKPSRHLCRTASELPLPTSCCLHLL